MTQHNNNLSLHQQGKDVALLQSRLITMGHTIATSEILGELFGESTQQAVIKFQQAEGLPVTGSVDDATAQAIVSSFEADKTVIKHTPFPIHPPETLVPPAISEGVLSKPVVGGDPLLHSPVGEVGGGVDVPPPPATGVPVHTPPGDVVITPPLPTGSGTTPPPGPASGSNSVQGQIFLDHGLPANGLVVRLYDRGFGGADTLLSETKTDSQGGYTFSYDTGGKAANLDIRAVGADGKEVSLSTPQYNADKQMVLNLVAPAGLQPLTTEYQRLSSDLNNHLGASGKLSEAREDSEHQDLSLLAQATGWDSRLVAIAATASKVSATTNMPQDALYALFRAGLPTDEQQLAWVSSEAVQKALSKANEVGIVSFTDQEVARVQATFDNFARSVRLTAQTPGTQSSFGELLSKSGLENNEPTVFADLYFAHQGTDADLWQQAQAQGIPQAKIDGLRLQGKLAALALNNADLVASLQQEIGTPDQLVQLVNKDLHQPDAWKARINTLAGNNEQGLQKLIPPAYSGDKTADRLDAYAADLARKTRVSFPTQVVGRMLEKGDLQLGQGHDSQSVHSYLQSAGALGFVLGQTPVDSFVRDNKEKIFQGATQDQITATTQSVKVLVSLYQITPTNESLKILLDQGFTSAHDVVAFPYDDFMQRYSPLFPSADEAQLVYRKAQQVSVVTYNFFSAAQQINSAPTLYVVSASPERRQEVKNNLIQYYPTMETLFGSLDFCECEHCRSVLSPAAYLVDLLQFLDPHPNVWASFLSDWKQKHNNAPYPFTDQAASTAFLNDWHTQHPGAPDPDTQKTPYDALIERRPDLPYLPLTCENTNTVMPYIDLVNEILEYFIAHGNLDPNAVHDTGSATTPELLAEPQYILRAAYDSLKQARYPLSLPFDLWLETVRRFFTYYQIPFWKVLDVFRPSNELFAPPVNAKSYYRAAIFAEYLGISPPEYALFTSANPLVDWFTLYGYKTENDALAALKSAKTLSRSLGVSYQDLIALVRTSFINPQLNTLGILYKLGVDTEDVFRYKGQVGYQPLSNDERAAFEKRLDDLSATFTTVGFDARAWLNTAWQNGDFLNVLVLADPNAGCNFDQTILRYANGNAADPLVFLKINLFVRLWKRSGWSMEETDRALQVFLPHSASPLTGTNLGTAFATALLYMAHLNALVEQSKAGQNSRLQLLTLWSDLATLGDLPLYARFFLKRSILQNDVVFDHPLGLYLRYFDAATKQYLPFHWDSSQPENPATGNVSLKSHLSSIQAALSLSADDIGQILVDAGKVLGTEPLTLVTLSLLYRYRLLAKALGLTVRDLIALKGLSGLDPFKSLSPDPLTQVAADHPLGQTLRFVEVVKSVKSSGFQVEDLNYLLRHRFDQAGKYRPDSDALLALVKTLAVGIRRIQDENAVPADSTSLTDDLLRRKLALALPPDAVDTFFAMWSGTVVYVVALDNVSPANMLNPADFAQEPTIQVSYDDIRQAQRLTFHGVLLDLQKTQIESVHSSPMLGTLLDKVENQVKTFFESYLQPFLKESDFEQLFTPLTTGLTDADKQTQMQARRMQLAQNFLPFLQQKLTRQFVVQTMATSLGADPTLTEDFLTDDSLLTDPTNPATPGQPGNPLLGAFASSAERGVSVAFFASADETGPASNAPALATTIDTAGKPAGTNSAHFEGYIEVPTSGAYRFFVALGKQNATAEFRLANLPDPLLRVSAAADNSEDSRFTELKAGVLYRFTLDVHNLGGGDASLLVQGENLPKGPLNRLTLYTQVAVERVTRAQILLAKTLQHIQTFGFSEREVRYLLTHAADFANLNLGNLPTRAGDDTPARATALFGQFLRLAGYASLKRDLAANTDDLVDLFAHARLTYPTSANAAQARAGLFDDLSTRVANLTRRDAATVKAVATALGFATGVTPVGGQLQVVAPDFVQEQGLQHLWGALQLVGTLGVSMDELQRWITPAPDFSIARDLRNTVKAHYEPEDWQRVAQSIFDKLRQSQRDALVAYIMQQQGFDRLEQLFEYFLIDPGMEPVVQTSRLRLVISSIQLYIQRCLLNLELKVHPSAINSQHWPWMKRYRVWEANRKIFLFPENWLEPEFRDDKTNLFRDLESALLQSDISNDLAEDAFFNYLKSLEALAHLDIVSMYCEEKPLDPASNTLHVIGRTHNSPHKYFYRRFAHQMWTPWEPVTTQIDGDHIVAVIWRQRLHLFWVTFMEKAKQPDTSSRQTYQQMGTTNITPPLKEVDVQLNWSEYFQGTWTPRQASDFGNPSDIGSGSFNSGDVFIYVTKEDNNGEEGAVNVHLSNPINKTFRVVNKNSQPQASNTYSSSPWLPYSHDRQAHATQYTDTGTLDVSFAERLETSDTSTRLQGIRTAKDILQQGENFSLLGSSNPPQLVAADDSEKLTNFFDSRYVIETLTRPFFYQDNQHTFLVEPTLTETKIDQWEQWVIHYPWPYAHFNTDQWWNNLPLQSAVPVAFRPPPVHLIDQGALYTFKPTYDWATNPATLVQYGDHFVGQGGGLTTVTPGSVAVLASGSVLNAGTVLDTGGVLNVIDKGGLTQGSLAHLKAEPDLNGARFVSSIFSRQ